MSIDDTIRSIVREEVRAALGERPAASGLDDLLKLPEAAREAKVSKSTLRKWVTDGKLVTYGAGRNTRVKRSELRLVLERRQEGAGPEARALAIISSLGRSRG